MLVRSRGAGCTRMRSTLFLLAVPLLLATAIFLCPAGAQAEPVFTYGAFHTAMTINADGSLLVSSKVSYDFQDPSGTVGLFIPASYGTLVEAEVLAGDGSPLPSDAWSYDTGTDGYTLWVDSSGAGPTATYIYRYLLYDALIQSGDRVGISSWGAVPAGRGSPIAETSVTLHYPAGADPANIELSVDPIAYSGQISQRFIGSDTAVVEAAFLGADSYYSVTSFWPSSIMDLSGRGFAAAQSKSWDFERFDCDISVNEDSSITVRETQVVNFRGSFTWLERYISTEPADFSVGRTYGRARVHDISVYGLDGQPLDEGMWSVDSDSGGKTVRIEFNATDEQMGWIIEYRMTGVLIFASEYDRLYWNAVSIERGVPIRNSAISVHPPQGANAAELQADQYVNVSDPPSGYESGLDGDVLWWRVGNIPPYTTFTIDVAFPKGLVAIPWQYDKACGIAVIAASSCILAAALLAMSVLWWKKGRDIGRTGTAMVRYEPPEGLSPAMLGMLMHEKPRVRDISASIVDLARRGYLTIIEEEKRSFIRMKSYSFQRTSQDLSGLLEYEREIMEGLFEAGERVSESDLKNKFYTRVNAILNIGVKDEVMKRKLFTREPGALRSRYLAGGIIIASLAIAAFLLLPRWLDLGWFGVLILVLVPVGGIVAGVGWAMPSRSAEGSKAYEHALGYRDFLETAEKPELQYMTPENFQSNLPYAMVLGVDEAWALKFADIYTTPPQWYSGSGAAFSTLYLTSSLRDMTASLNSTLTSSPRSSGSGSGGFGGGSSGGGFGGGGSSAG
ncbi:MAG: DUF2207 domain-containing protein [Actinomycetota bacterium]